jgi:hypothetical protein
VSLLAGPYGFSVDPETGNVFGPRGFALKPLPTNCGYFRVAVRLPGDGMKKRLIHRVVWEAVNGPIPDGLQINHKNGDKSDNRIENLELVTASENVVHAFQTGLRVPVRGNARLTEDDVRSIRAEYEPGMVRMQDLAVKHGVALRTISFIIRRETWAGVV